jgi:hypothetical protein
MAPHEQPLYARRKVTHCACGARFAALRERRLRSGGHTPHRTPTSA